jgi:hypothetical protein
MNKKIKEMVMRNRHMPDVEAFLNRAVDLVPEFEEYVMDDAALDAVLEAFAEAIWEEDDPEDNHEFRTTRNWMRGFSLLFWTERIDGAQDYKEIELEFMDLMAKYWAADPDFLVHADTRLLMPSNN